MAYKLPSSTNTGHKMTKYTERKKLYTVAPEQWRRHKDKTKSKKRRLVRRLGQMFQARDRTGMEM